MPRKLPGAPSPYGGKFPAQVSLSKTAGTPLASRKRKHAPGRFGLAAALADKRLLGAALDNIKSWAGWLACLKAADGERLTEQERIFFAEVAGGREPPAAPVSELYLIAGRRSGKSRCAGAVAVHEALFREHELAPGEKPYVLVIAPSKEQAKIVHGYCLGFLQASPILAKEIAEVRAEEIVLKNGVTLGIHSSSFRAVRGRTLVCAVLDELAFFRSDESANPDREVLRAITPSLMTTGGRLCCISSPYSQRGVLWQKFGTYFGSDDPQVLVVKGASRQFNPTLDQEAIERELQADPEAARAEWLGQFRSDLSTYIDENVLRACVTSEALHDWPSPAFRYTGFVDVSGGKSDSHALAIAHREVDGVFVDFVREWPASWSPADAVEEICGELKRWRISRVHGDRYGAGFTEDAFRAGGIAYSPSPMPKSQLYVEALPLFRSRSVVLPAHERLITQLSSLERRSGRSGRDTVDHPPGGKDDVANAVCGAIVLCRQASAHPRRSAGSILIETAKRWDPIEGTIH